MSKFSHALQRINLKETAKGPQVMLPDAGEGTTQEPFDFPNLPYSTLNWLGALGQRVWNEHRKCCALLLLINPQRRCWGVTTPPQKPRRDGVSWQMTEATPVGDHSGEPLYVGGTFQMAQVEKPEQAVGLVPEIDGLHLVHAVDVFPTGAWTFLRMEGRLSLRYADEVIYNDWDARINDVIRVLGLKK